MGILRRRRTGSQFVLNLEPANLSDPGLSRLALET